MLILIAGLPPGIGESWPIWLLCVWAAGSAMSACAFSFIAMEFHRLDRLPGGFLVTDLQRQPRTIDTMRMSVYIRVAEYAVDVMLLFIGWFVAVAIWRIAVGLISMWVWVEFRYTVGSATRRLTGVLG